ncbi:MAG: DUF2064 domain-containing protein [Planctomycetes bacterium]|nr:DUF2064 domain-containing protein [Planctomycetota bacterium]
MRRLLVFCKEPVPGQVKTRLAASIGAEAAADLAWALLRDTCRLAGVAARRSGARLELHHAPREPGPRLAALLSELGCEARPQSEGTLGERLAAGLSPNEEGRIALGSDAPDLPPEQIVAAFEQLDSGSALASPAADGGYVLLGLGPETPAQALTSPAIRWSSAHTLADTRAALETAGALWLPPLAGWSDLDEIEDLWALADRLEGCPETAPASAAWIEARRDRLPARTPPAAAADLDTL